MGNNGKAGKKKTRKEVQAYKRFVKYDNHNQQATVTIDNDNLRGSGEIGISPILSANEPVVSTTYKIKRFVKNHLFETIFAPLLCAFLIWCASTIISLKVDLAVVQTRLEYLDEQIDGLDADSTTKEIIDMQLETIKNDLSNDFELKLSKIESQLDLIEQQIVYIEKRNTGNAE